MLDNDTLSDKEVLDRSFDNPRYFEVLVDRYQDAFLRKSLSIIQDREAAEDIVQETFLKIYKHGRGWKAEKQASFKSWAYIILRNTCYSYYKKEKRHKSHLQLVDFQEYDFEDTEATLGQGNENEPSKLFEIESILSLMPSSMAKVLRLYFLEEKSQKEIAQIENISHGAVRARIYRAKRSFRKLSTNTT